MFWKIGFKKATVELFHLTRIESSAWSPLHARRPWRRPGTRLRRPLRGPRPSGRARAPWSPGPWRRDTDFLDGFSHKSRVHRFSQMLKLSIIQYLSQMYLEYVDLNITLLKISEHLILSILRSQNINYRFIAIPEVAIHIIHIGSRKLRYLKSETYIRTFFCKR